MLLALRGPQATQSRDGAAGNSKDECQLHIEVHAPWRPLFASRLVPPSFGSASRFSPLPHVERTAKILAGEPLRFANPSCFAHHYWFACAAHCHLLPALWRANIYG